VGGYQHSLRKSVRFLHCYICHPHNLKNSNNKKKKRMEEKRRGGGDRRGEIGEGEKEREKCTYPASQISHGQEPPPPD
jgi:hypothetical protein